MTYFGRPCVPQRIWLPQPGERLEQKNWKPSGQIRRKVRSVLIKAESWHGFSFRVRAWTEMEIWCVKGMVMLKVLWSKKKKKIKKLINPFGCNEYMYVYAIGLPRPSIHCHFWNQLKVDFFLLQDVVNLILCSTIIWLITNCYLKETYAKYASRSSK